MLRQYKGVSPRLGPGAYVDESAQVIGDVEIGAEASVWMHAAVRGDVHDSERYVGYRLDYMTA